MKLLCNYTILVNPIYCIESNILHISFFTNDPHGKGGLTVNVSFKPSGLEVIRIRCYPQYIFVCMCILYAIPGDTIINYDTTVNAFL